MPNKINPNRAGTGPGVSLDDAARFTRTGDLWLFRGRKPGDRAIQIATNSPVNHVGMAVVLEDLPPLMWHAELGRSLPDLWSGNRHRGVQLHDLRAAVTVWSERYGQRAWLRQLDPAAGPEAEDAVLRTIARLDGTPFPSTAGLASRWLRGRVPSWAGRVELAEPGRPTVIKLPSLASLRGLSRPAAEAVLETAYCAEVLAVTYQAMGLLDGRHQTSWYDPGRFWSGDDLHLAGGHHLGGEIPVTVPAPPSAPPKAPTGSP
ncbi:MAG TPA: hypothetical protein VN847_00265 [Streptosporangiaceae bacterium]|nr:hypothetical protein [Streptosporangiaceae bacterium]